MPNNGNKFWGWSEYLNKQRHWCVRQLWTLCQINKLPSLWNCDYLEFLLGRHDGWHGRRLTHYHCRIHSRISIHTATGITTAFNKFLNNYTKLNQPRLILIGSTIWNCSNWHMSAYRNQTITAWLKGFRNCDLATPIEKQGGGKGAVGKGEKGGHPHLSIFENLKMSTKLIMYYPGTMQINLSLYYLTRNLLIAHKRMQIVTNYFCF